MSDLWSAIAIAIIIEGMIPFLSPKSWKETVNKITQLPETKIRLLGLAAMIVGLLLLSVLR
ncbi:DUF2065 domain-containing protein [Aliikangiella sp. IMCC44359]|uniref:DUF2065 domain-containing protein n=1 Tax=Aliikangiella sp. IMCC44359 TaxID=3459125 RepID=UPI00403AEEA0